jgi:hypothetical protein
MFDHFYIVFNSLFSDTLVHVLQRAEFIAQRLAGLILESIRINRVKFKFMFSSKGFYSRCISGNIPGNMQRNCTTGTIERMEQTNVFNFCSRLPGSPPPLNRPNLVPPVPSAQLGMAI